MNHRSRIKTFLKNKNILVTGGTGSIGGQIVSALLEYEPKKIVVFNKDDSKQFLMKEKYRPNPKLFFILGDIRDYSAIEYATRNIDLVFHVAALKQVPVCEDHPFEAVKTNIIGSENVIRACIKNKVKKVVNVSTDKAVNPTNTMGATKLISEKLFSNANNQLNNKDTVFCSVRFGNVINSRGSVIPLFMKQAKEGKPLTVTDPEMTRFFMSISEAAELTLKSIYYAKGGETFIFKMKALKLHQLTEAIQSFCQQKKLPLPDVIEIGSRPGEKKYEELLHAHETERLYEDDELFVILPEVLPSYHHFKPSSQLSNRSDHVPSINKSEIIHILEQLDGENDG
ncbi:SDR family NAD(P)-dependent oxidoreductase [Alteribacter aurantiacus]|uniref:SDR family NAD(P)-dependent oxidoreductase n=1 Tax=Alteribacter aurantiacus TaxID=254410 RepID=UPI0004287121|nr:SDR family NAD(P)-dependent oxidoreductase [Alteribacter aurantiacus]